MFINVDKNEDFRTLVKELEKLFHKSFDVISEWKPLDVGARYTLFRVYGVLVHAWKRKVFSLLTTSFVILIEFDPTNRNMQRWMWLDC